MSAQMLVKQTGAVYTLRQILAPFGWRNWPPGHTIEGLFRVATNFPQQQIIMTKPSFFASSNSNKAQFFKIYDMHHTKQSFIRFRLPRLLPMQT